MCYEIDEERDDGSIIGRTMVYSGQNKDGHRMVRDEGIFEVNANGEIMSVMDLQDLLSIIFQIKD